MSAPSAKRPRVASIIDGQKETWSSPDRAAIIAPIESLNENDMRKALLEIAISVPRASDVVFRAVEENKRKEAARVINFDHLSKSVWYTLNKEYSRLSGSNQYDRSGDAYDLVTSAIGRIAHEVKVSSSFGTKASALSTMRKIAKSIALSSNDSLGHEVRKLF